MRHSKSLAFPGLPPSSRGQGLIERSTIGRLKAVLDQYPDDGQILKARLQHNITSPKSNINMHNQMFFQEIVQNADDAGARQVRFMLDETHYGEKYLLPTEGGLEKYQACKTCEWFISLIMRVDSL